MIYDEKHVITCPGIVCWDGITNPDKEDDGSIKAHSMKIAIPNGCPEHIELHNLAMAALAADPKFKGTMPKDGSWPLAEADVSALGPLVTGMVTFNAKTRNGIPFIADANGAELPAMRLAQSFYPGAMVKLMVHAFSFDKKSKGIAFGLDGIQVIDTTTPKLDVGGGLNKNEVASAFGGKSIPPTSQAPTSPAQPATGAPTPPTPPGATAVSAPSIPTPVTPNPAIREVPAVPTPPAAAAVPTPPAQRVLTAAANGHSYETLIAAGWTDETLRAAGMMV